MPMDDLAARFHAVDTTAICDADKTVRVLDNAIRARSATTRVIGPAFTVRCQDDLLGVLRAIETAAPGDVVVVDGGGRELAFGGELFARGALVRGLAGIIVDGGYRDIGYVSGGPLPVYSRSITPVAAPANRLGELQVPVTCGGVVVRPGDVVLADDEGVIVVDAERVAALLDAAAAIKATERRLIEKLAAGETLSNGMNLQEHVESLRGGTPSTLTFRV